jgi:hypothetical protein
MRITEKSLTSIDLNFIISSIYTLSAEHIILNNIFLDIVKVDIPFSDKKTLKEVRYLLNKHSLRMVTSQLVKSCSILDYYLSNSKIENQNITVEIYNETLFLKKYLRKFKYNYKRYFFHRNKDYENLFTNRELNIYAIKALFLIAGL